VAQAPAATEPRTAGQPSLRQAQTGGYPAQHATGAHPGMAGLVGNAPTGAHPAMHHQGYPTPGQGQPPQQPPAQPREQTAMGSAYEREPSPPPPREALPEPRFGSNTGHNPRSGGDPSAHP